MESEANFRLLRDGENTIPRAADLPVWVKFILCFFGGFNPLLWVASVFVFLSYEPFGTPPSNIYNLALFITLLLVISVAGLFNFYQEVQSSQVLAFFNKLAPSDCNVRRGGEVKSMQPSKLVVGDIVLLETGIRVPADLRIIESSGLKIDKSMLTGENEPFSLYCDPVPDSTIMLQSTNMAFMGCNVVDGTGIGVVLVSGKDSQLAKIIDKIADGNNRLSNLQRELNNFVLLIGILALITTAIVVSEWAGYLNVKHYGFMTTSTMIADAISVIVAYVPEGLPVSLSTGLTLIGRRLCLKHRVVVKKMSIIETVGCMSMLCTDKTGTITQNKMTVTKIVNSNDIINVLEGSISTKLGDALCERLYAIACLCNQSTLNDTTGEVVGGNGVDRSLLKFLLAEKVYNTVRKDYEVKCRVPFSSTTKTAMTVVKKKSCNAVVVTVKGAPEYVLEKCTHYVDPSSGKKEILTPEIAEKILSNVRIVSDMGERVVALGESPVLSQDIYHFKYEYSTYPKPNFPVTGFIFIGCVSVSDPPKPEVKVSVVVKIVVHTIANCVSL